ncbi:glycoside hydrolase superfamily [Fennellomyces sp. T-0311]|nr:glycoside hydrolase superfamily [Fennellomyces sp. T-0311]
MQVNGPWFIEPKTQRTVLFRGINLSGGTKIPVAVPSHEPNGFWVDYDRNVSFVGRPFPLDEADIHLQRLVDHGFNLLRFMVTWEAIEHAGPRIYDDDYLNYVIAVLEKCRSHGLKVYLNPHQDCWSRHCGGSGHPGWTHTLVGLDPAHFAETNAAIVHNVYPEPENFPKMIWNTNYQKLAAATLFTLFYAGKTLAPKCIIDGINVQDYLQQHYLDAYTELVKRVHDNGLEGHVVIGYDTMNEPGQGYIGRQDLSRLPDDDVDFKKGWTPTSFEGMKLGMGIPTEVDDWVFTWRGPKPNGRITIDPQGKKAWLDAKEQADADRVFGWKRAEEWKAGCIWANHGIWEGESILRADYFAQSNFAKHWTEFMTAYSERIRSIHHDAILFVQPPIMETPPKIGGERLALAPHWYDGLTLVKKKWCSYNVDYINLKRGKYGTGPLRFVRALRIGEKAIRQCFVDQIETLKVEGQETLGPYPFIIGEIGIPYDMEPVKQSSILGMLFGWLFRAAKYYPIDSPESPQNKAMDASIQAAERNLVSYTLWTYVPDNHPTWGDLWNGEDLSIWQNEMIDDVSQESDTSSETLLPETIQGKLGTSTNMRDIVSLHRPHPHKIAGQPTSIVFTSPTDKQRASYDFAFQSNVDVQGPTEIYVPTVHFPMPDAPVNPTEVNISSGRYKAQSYNGKYWSLLWYCDESGDQALRLIGQPLQQKTGY